MKVCYGCLLQTIETNSGWLKQKRSYWEAIDVYRIDRELKEPGSENEQELLEVRQKKWAEVNTRNGWLESPHRLLSWHYFLQLLPGYGRHRPRDSPPLNLCIVPSQWGSDPELNLPTCERLSLNIQELCKLGITMFVLGNLPQGSYLYPRNQQNLKTRASFCFALFSSEIRFTSTNCFLKYRILGVNRHLIGWVQDTRLCFSYKRIGKGRDWPFRL